MPLISPTSNLKQVIQDIEDPSEITRRSYADRRLAIYRDGGRKYLIEQLRREFGNDSLKEMRLCPVSILKKIVNKRSQIYKRPPQRSSEQNQDLVDFYVEELSLNEQMQKANRYYNLLSNTALYPRVLDGRIVLNIVPDKLYSVIPDRIDRTQANTWLFNAFIESDESAPDKDLQSATGRQGFDREPGAARREDLLASKKEVEDRSRMIVVWNDAFHWTMNEKGIILFADPSQGPEQFINPIGKAPVVNLAKDRDNEFWATQGEDTVDLSLVLQAGWTDVLTIAKHQGFSVLTIVAKQEPKTLTLGINKSIFIRSEDDGPQPSINYLSTNTNLADYNMLLMDILGLLLSTNHLDPKTVGGQMSSQNFTSGFHALIQMSDNLEAIEMDKPALMDAELELWELIKLWHNWLIDMNLAADDVKKMGKFADDFTVDITYADVKPLESEMERITMIKQLLDTGLVSRKDAIRKLHPDMDDAQVEAKIQEIEDEKKERQATFMTQFGGSQPPQTEEPAKEEDGEEASS